MTATRKIPDSLLAAFSECVALRTALHFPKERWTDLERKIQLAAREFAFESELPFIEWAVSSSPTREQMDVIASHLTVSETYFWREPRVFEALVERVLPELMALRRGGDRRLRIWSAGCSTGEEPYSIAIALRRAVPDLEQWRINILATDINPRILQKAAGGVYGNWSFRNAPDWLRETHFRRRTDGKYEILPNVREMVTFAYLNLADDVYPSLMNNTHGMDIIFCRNVLMYFSPERARQVGEGLRRSLVEDGWLVVSSAELSPALFPRFTSVHFPSAILYRKLSPAPPSAQAFLFDHFPPEPVPKADAVLAETAAAPAPEEARAATPAARAPIQQLIALPTTPGDSRHTVAAAIRALADEGRLAEAVAACDKALAEDICDPGLHFLRAAIMQEQNKEGEAMDSLRRALYLDPRHVPAQFAMGNLALRRGNARAAEKCFQNILSLLSGRPPRDVLPDADGLTVGRFIEIVNASLQMGAPA